LIETERWRHLATSTTHDTDLPLAVLERAQDGAGNQVAARNASLIGLVLCFCCSHFVPESPRISPPVARTQGRLMPVSSRRKSPGSNANSKIADGQTTIGMQTFQAYFALFLYAVID